jgi:hypothetical protein
MPKIFHACRALLPTAALFATSSPALALDKQGSAHAGDVDGETSGLAASGAAAIGIAPYNPSYAARPDNTGLALMRYALHMDLDLVGRRLSIPVDLNVFSDRQRRGARKILPSELDAIVGVTSTWDLGPGALELGTRLESDRPVDRGSFTQSYLDVRARYLYSLANQYPGADRALGGGDLAGWATLGVFAVNPTYAARPDNSGLALFRYALHTELSFLEHHAAIGLDGTLFTDKTRRATSVLAPSELDFTPELIARWHPFEAHLAYERDMPLDRKGTRPGYVQHFVYVLFGWAFDLAPHAVKEEATAARVDPRGGDAPSPSPAPTR